ncbi:serine hydrolase [Nocardioides szechwanensis]|uniref:Dipeptidyl aminopeptidase/acylaminoacyl peptidase n=1 Tax=Nocardioides szechwanensis TaxID=1005944 RepID=A0A1G9Z937_9ACTN|nr:serine hydrolase [Nocardioides szechwanensis]GEP33854.1 serine hydrolase [Nocardioides szechwanensis]SDN17655.1 Dipeptidyl aminopeptidase/acylaminoacyl peptidase [Nocardioides szechwanensis]
MTRRMRIDDLTALAVPSQPALSPDGSRLAYVLRTLDGEADRNVDQLWVVPTGDRATDGSPRRLTSGTGDTSPRWSPDGSRLAFVRAGDGPGQVWLLAADGGEPEQVTDLPLGADAPVWSPDGSRIAFTAAVDPAARGTGPIVTTRLDYQADGAGMFGSVRSQLHVLDVATGDCRQLTDGPEHAGEPAWATDGRTLAFTRHVGEDSDLTFRTAVHLLDIDDAQARPRVVAFEDGIAGTVSNASDGSLLVVGWAGSLVGHARLFRVPLDGGDVQDLTGHLDRNVMPGATAYPGARPVDTDDGALFCLRDRGCTHLWRVAGGHASPMLDGDGRVVSGLSVAGSSAAVVLATPTSYGEVVLLDLATGAERVLTDHGAALADVELFERVPRTFTISDGTEVQAWVIRDPELSAPGPLLLDIHGGPHNAWNDAADEMHVYHQELAARGWTVLLVNPRGSDGYGAAFYDGVNGAWGVADADDFLEPIDVLVAEGLADADRLAVTGYSYGGFMTCYLTAHDGRFKAAVPGGLVSDLTSMYGTCDDGALLSGFELGGTPWEKPEQYAAMSPLTRVADVTTPTLVLHGGGDLTCDLGQAQQWHTSLRHLGVPTQLVIYPEQSHAFILTGRPSHRADYNRRVVDWVEQYTVAAGRPRIDLAHWEQRLAALAARHKVPGAQLGILRISPETQDELVTASYGVLNLGSQVPATTESLFQIGSISKVWTATVAMQLVDEGLLELDGPICEVLPELRLSDPDVTKTVTLRHLLNHTSGIDGDVFTDTGRGDDCLEKYVDLLADAGQNHPLGATWSYCNSGYSLIGRLIEKVTGTTWDQAMKDRLFTPLGLARTVTLPEDALLHSAATGHLEHEGQQLVAPVWQLPRSLGPAGLITATAADVLAFARLHLNDGVAADGTRLLSEDSTAAMAAHQADLPDKIVLGDSWGLGWIRFGWGGHRLIGHDGNTIGQGAFLRMLSEQGLAVTLLTNGGNARDLYQDLYRELFAELAGVEMAEPFVPPADAEVDITPYVGTYQRHSVLMEVFVGDDGPRLRTTLSGPIAEMIPDPVDEHPLVPAGPGLFAVRPPGTETWAPVTFYELPTGERYLHFGVRATPRVD